MGGTSPSKMIFADRIGQTALQYLAKFHRGLAHVMAHEVGHLLLGTHSHAPTGLMAVSWLPLETRLQTLTPDQAHVIRVRASDRGHVAPAHRLAEPDATTTA